MFSYQMKKNDIKRDINLTNKILNHDLFLFVLPRICSRWRNISDSHKQRDGADEIF